MSGPWKAKNWESVDHFKRVQRLWTLWGTVLFFIGIVLVVLLVLFSFILAASM